MFPTSPDVITNIAGIAITNSLLTTIIISTLLCIFVIHFSKNISYVPGKIQTAIEIIISIVFDLAKSMADEEKAKKFFPWVMTFFIIIIVENLMGLLPIFGPIQVLGASHKMIPLFRTVNSDLNSTLAMALISAVMTHFFAISYLGVWKYLKKFFSIRPLDFFTGIIELITEFAKVLTLSFRLFGNVYAGDSLLGLAGGLSYFLIPVPFMLFEMFIGSIQAIVFMMLTLVFMSVLSTDQHT